MAENPLPDILDLLPGERLRSISYSRKVTIGGVSKEVGIYAVERLDGGFSTYIVRTPGEGDEKADVLAKHGIPPSKIDNEVGFLREAIGGVAAICGAKPEWHILDLSGVAWDDQGRFVREWAGGIGV